MEKNALLRQRKEFKKNAHRVVRSHYVVLFFMTLVMILHGTEFNYIRERWGDLGSQDSDAQESDVGSVLDSGTVLGSIMSGQLFEGEAASEQLENEIREKGDPGGALGRSRGVLAQAVNALSSGKLYAMLGNAIYDFCRVPRP